MARAYGSYVNRCIEAEEDLRMLSKKAAKSMEQTGNLCRLHAAAMQVIIRHNLLIEFAEQAVKNDKEKAERRTDGERATKGQEP